MRFGGPAVWFCHKHRSRVASRARLHLPRFTLAGENRGSAVLCYIVICPIEVDFGRISANDKGAADGHGERPESRRHTRALASAPPARGRPAAP